MDALVLSHQGLKIFPVAYAQAHRLKQTGKQTLPVAMRLGVTPVLIPNTTVKTQAAEGTMLETIWENRWPPDLKEKRLILWAHSSAG